MRIGDLPLSAGGTLRAPKIAYETWGTPSEEAVLICHALTGDAHVAASGNRPGWWDGIVGPGRAIDTRRHYVVASNVLGGCYGSSGPDSAGLSTGGTPFPQVSVEDMVLAQHRLLQLLGVRRLRLVVGGSLGGLQALSWANCRELSVQQVVAIGASDRLPALQLALCHAQHVALELGIAHGDPEGGLRAARAVAMTTYRTDGHFAERFGRTPASRADKDRTFALETWLDHHGDRLAERFSAHSYLVLSRAMAQFQWDGAVRPGTRVDLIGITGDWLFPAQDVEALHRRLRNQGVPGGHLVLATEIGHDAFLAEQAATGQLLSALLERAEGARPSQACAL
ncbi:MAG: homoserine O-acetyltransferase [Thermaerobacter sp.]|nr:homoserine O-acetyltransferase [Thermaerobacter sp.]